jgi:hypothetical protein
MPRRGRIMKPDLYIGPLIERYGKFSYQTFSLAEGLRSSFGYRRVEEARYDRRAMVAEVGSDQHFSVHVCEILTEFERVVEAARYAAENPDECNRTALDSASANMNFPSVKKPGYWRTR